MTPYELLRSRDRAVGVHTGHGFGARGILVQFPAGQQIYLPSNSSRLALETSQPLFSEGRGLFP
jgi:hypothetical protein